MLLRLLVSYFFFFKQKTAYEMRISDWSSDVCSSDLYSGPLSMFGAKAEIAAREKGLRFELVMVPFAMATLYSPKHPEVERINPKRQVPVLVHRSNGGPDLELFDSTQIRSEEHTSELQSLMRIPYAVFCLKKKT